MRMNEKRIEELLEELIRITKIVNFESIKASIEKTLNNENKRKAFMLTGIKQQSEICKILKMGATTVSEMWQECALKGFLRKEGRGYKPLLDLEEYGLVPDGFDITGLTDGGTPDAEGKAGNK